ncbi:restriction endonuclease subunit S [Limosilactobacillus sp. DJ3M12]|nr:restriction endonuclease subunit S [Limosilactobacillus sp. DJ3M12]
MKIKLKEIGKIITGKTPPKNEKDAYGNTMNFLTPSDLKGQRFSDITARQLSEKGVRGLKNNIVSGPSISVSCIGSNMGKTIFNKEAIITNQQLNSITFIRNDVNPLYLYYLLISKRELLHFIGSNQGSTMPILNKNDFGNLEFEIPSFEEQNYISGKLNLLDREIELNNQINDNLISLATALFNKYFPNINSGNEMIGNFISNYDRLRKPLSKKERLSIPGKYRYIGATSVNDYINKYNFDGIYLLLGEDGTVEDDNGYPILQYISGKFWPNNHAHVLQGKNVSTEWLYLFFKQRKITSIVTGAVQKKISQKNLNSLSISIPDKDKLARFDTIINPIFKNIRIIESENHSLEKIKVELLSKLF